MLAIEKKEFVFYRGDLHILPTSVPKNFAIFTGKHLCWIPFLIQNIGKFFRALILKNICKLYQNMRSSQTSRYLSTSFQGYRSCVYGEKTAAFENVHETEKT